MTKNPLPTRGLSKSLPLPGIPLLAVCALLLCSGGAFAALKPPAQPASALFYPDQVQLSVEERLRPEILPGRGKGFLLILPATAHPSSFAVTLDGLPAAGFSWLDPDRDIPGGGAAPFRAPATRPEEEKDPDRRALLQTLAGLQAKADALEADLETLDLRIGLWREAGEKGEQPGAEERLKADAAIKDLLPGLLAARSAGERLRDDHNVRLQEAEEDLDDYDRKHARQAVFIPAQTPDGKTALLRYTYILPGTCRASYDLCAFPAQNNLTVAQSASLRQSSGFAWKDVEVFISTSGRDLDLDPSPLPPWRIRLSAEPPRPPLPAPRQQNARARLNAAQSAVVLDEAPGEDGEEEAKAREVFAGEEEKGAFRLWSLGRRDIDTDIDAVVPLAFNEYPARFHYTLRPLQNPRGFLSAALSLEQPLELPVGQARFFVDSVFVGERPFSLNGREAVLHFGSDPQVVVTRVDKKRASGEEGFLSKEQSVLWHWDFIVRNTRNRPVEAWVEDALPDALDSAVSVAAVSDPRPEEEVLEQRQGGTKVYRWKLSLAPGEVRTISHKVTIRAPVGKFLDPGREE